MCSTPPRVAAHVFSPRLRSWLATFVLATGSGASAFGCNPSHADDPRPHRAAVSPEAVAGKARAVAPPSSAAEAEPSPGPAAASAPPAPVPTPAAEAPPPPQPTFGPAALTALSPEQRASLLAGPEDDPIEVETHYIQSNETRHDLFFENVDGVGGAYVGVGSDQNYTVAAKARAELMFLLDIDTRVTDLHRMYEVLIPASDTPRQLVDRWHESQAAQTRQLLEQALEAEDPAIRRRILVGFAGGRETVYRHLERVIHRRRGGQGTTWLSDPAMYDHIRALYQTQRVRIMIGNLAGSQSLHTVAAAARELGEPVRVLYMSNAEEYFKYTPVFRKSVRDLPVDERSVLLRTIYSQRWEHADLWAYQVQRLPDFAVRLAEPANRSRTWMLRLAAQDGQLEKDLGIEGFSRVGFAGPKPT